MVRKHFHWDIGVGKDATGHPAKFSTIATTTPRTPNYELNVTDTRQRNVNRSYRILAWDQFVYADVTHVVDAIKEFAVRINFGFGDSKKLIPSLLGFQRE